MNEKQFSLQLRELREASKPYLKEWSVWIKSPSCFLDIYEVKAVDSFLKSSSYKISCKEINVTEMMFFITIKNATVKLKLFLVLFKKYQKIIENIPE